MLVVKISPFYVGRGWYDPKTGITFQKALGPVRIPEGLDLTNIERNIRNNVLIITSGSIEEYKRNPITEVVKPTFTEVITNTIPVEEVVTITQEVQPEPEIEPEQPQEEVAEVEKPANPSGKKRKNK